MSLSSKLYDVLKPVALIYLPALATLYFVIAGIWGIPDSNNVVGTLSAIDVFLGGVLGVSSSSYQTPSDGNITVSTTGLKIIELPGLTVEDVKAKKTITLSVTPESESKS